MRSLPVAMMPGTLRACSSSSQSDVEVALVIWKTKKRASERVRRSVLIVRDEGQPACTFGLAVDAANHSLTTSSGNSNSSSRMFLMSLSSLLTIGV